MKHESKQSIKQKRLDTLLNECKETVINTTLSAFYLNKGVFSDRDGGNVTTMHNFEKDTDQFVADKDKGSHKEANKEFNRDDWELTTEEWKEKREGFIDADGKTKDGYSGRTIDSSEADLDHIRSLKGETAKKKNHLAYNTGTEEGKEKLKEKLNSDDNLTMTDSSINRSKGSKSNQEFYKGPKRKQNESDAQYEERCEKHQKRLKEKGVTKENLDAKDKQAEEAIDTDGTLMKKQANELLETGTKQAKDMAISKAMGFLLVEVVNIIFSEIKTINQEKGNLDIKTLEGIVHRIPNHCKVLMEKIPNFVHEVLQGGVSGFVSNLITFLINNFLSTVKRFVTIIREGLLGIYKAVKMIFFPPKEMTKEEVWRSAIKLLSTTVLSAVIISFTDAIKVFIASIPLLIPISDPLAIAITGILSGLASALAAYAIDSIFDYFLDRRNEQAMDLLMNNSEQRSQIAEQLIDSFETSKKLVINYDLAIGRNQVIGDSFAEALEHSSSLSKSNHDILSGFRELIEEAKIRIEETKEGIESSNKIHEYLNNFLSKY